jgi:hypothetical protein
VGAVVTGGGEGHVEGAEEGLEGAEAPGLRAVVGEGSGGEEDPVVAALQGRAEALREGEGVGATRSPGSRPRARRASSRGSKGTGSVIGGIPFIPRQRGASGVGSAGAMVRW